MVDFEKLCLYIDVIKVSILAILTCAAQWR